MSVAEIVEEIRKLPPEKVAEVMREIFKFFPSGPLGPFGTPIPPEASFADTLEQVHFETRNAPPACLWESLATHPH